MVLGQGYQSQDFGLQRPPSMPSITQLEVMCGKDYLTVHLAFSSPFNVRKTSINYSKKKKKILWHARVIHLSLSFEELVSVFLFVEPNLYDGHSFRFLPIHRYLYLAGLGIIEGAVRQPRVLVRNPELGPRPLWVPDLLQQVRHQAWYGRQILWKHNHHSVRRWAHRGKSFIYSSEMR